MLSFFDCPKPVALILKWYFSSSSRLGNCKNVKNTMFLTRNPYRLWSFQLGAQNMSKIGSFSENLVFCDTKLKQSVLHQFPGARTLIWLLSCSLTLICTKVWELSAGKLVVNKRYGAQSSECTACRGCKNGPANLRCFWQIKGKLSETPKIMHFPWSSNVNLTFVL